MCCSKKQYTDKHFKIFFFFINVCLCLKKGKLLYAKTDEWRNTSETIFSHMRGVGGQWYIYSPSVVFRYGKGVSEKYLELRQSADKHFRSGLYRWWLSHCEPNAPETVFCRTFFPLSFHHLPWGENLSQFPSSAIPCLVTLSLLSYSPWPCSGGNGRLKLVNCHCH